MAQPGQVRLVDSVILPLCLRPLLPSCGGKGGLLCSPRDLLIILSL